MSHTSTATAVSPDSAHGPVPAALTILAAFSGFAAFVLFLLIPFLPVSQTQSSLSWPQNDSLNSVNAPLISVAPEKINAEIPLQTVDMLRDEQSLIFGTIPPSGPEATDRGMFVTVNPDNGIDVAVLNDVVLQLSEDDVHELADDAVLRFSLDGDGAQFEIPGTEFSETVDEDVRPQLTGIYTEIDNTDENARTLIDAGLTVDVEINSRFTSTPTLTKQIAMWLGTALAVVALWTLWRQDRTDGRRHIPVSKGRWKKVRPLDGLVAAILGFWHVFGANTSDDGFILTMARVSDNAGYMANYYRWYGVPEAPFGSPFYELLAVMTQVSASSLWMRLPSLFAGIAIWLLLSREILPRLGTGIDSRRVAHWTAAFMFLAFWLPYNNGIRPEPMVAVGTLIAWALFERAIATDRLYPAAVGTVVAAITLTVGPTGLTAVGVFLVSLPSLTRVLGRRRKANPSRKKAVTLGVVGPFLGVGTFVFVPVFADQTLAAVLESTRVRGIVGPALEWYMEYVRYSTLFQQSVDGSLTRRFAMFTMLICLGLVLYALQRNGQVPGADKGPTIRLIAIVGVSMFFLMFTPTKWTHHFGIYAGIAGALAALGAVVLSQIAARSPRSRTFALAGVTFLLAITFAGWNGWWYVSSFGVPWWDKTPSIKGIEFATIILAVSLVILAFGIIQTFRHEYQRSVAVKEGSVAGFDERDQSRANRWSSLMTAPVAVVSILVVSFSLLTFTKAFIDQYPAYSVGLGNVKALGGNTAYLADEAMLETNTNESFLTPLDGEPLGESLDNDEVRGFHPNGIPDYIITEETAAANVGAIAGAIEDSSPDGATGSDANAGTTDDMATGAEPESDSTPAEDSSPAEGMEALDEATSTSSDSDTPTADTSGGVRELAGINGSHAHLPFNINPDLVPVLGSWEDEPSTTAEATSSWYELPERSDSAPLLVVSAAGRIAHHDRDGVEEPGEELKLEYGLHGDDGEVEVLGEEEFMDIGPYPTWRNLRIPLDNVPEEADTVRLVANDKSLDPDDWIAFTPPRVPELTAMSELIDDTAPALLDWSVALQFPQQRSFDHYAGVTEIPEYRIAPDHEGKEALTGFMDFLGGGSLATVEAVNTSYEIPSYTRHDWSLDWGSIERYERRADSDGNVPDDAVVDHEEILRSGWWSESKMNIREP